MKFPEPPIWSQWHNSQNFSPNLIVQISEDVWWGGSPNTVDCSSDQTGMIIIIRLSTWCLFQRHNRQFYILEKEFSKQLEIMPPGLHTTQESPYSSTFESPRALVLKKYLILWAMRHKFESNPTSNSNSKSFQDFNEARKILNASTFEERSLISHKFMVKQFGIENSLSTLDHSWFRESLRETKFILTTDDEWNRLAEFSNDYISQCLSIIRPGQSIKLRIFVECFAFRVAILKLYPEADLYPSDQLIRAITSEIIELYDMPEKEEEEIALKKSILLAQISRLFGIYPDGEIPTRKNPLNNLFVAFDAMQRVVLRCFLELRFRRKEKRMGRMSIFAQLKARDCLEF